MATLHRRIHWYANLYNEMIINDNDFLSTQLYFFNICKYSINLIVIQKMPSSAHDCSTPEMLMF